MTPRGLLAFCLHLTETLALATMLTSLSILFVIPAMRDYSEPTFLVTFILKRRHLFYRNVFLYKIHTAASDPQNAPAHV